MVSGFIQEAGGAEGAVIGVWGIAGAAAGAAAAAVDASHFPLPTFASPPGAPPDPPVAVITIVGGTIMMTDSLKATC
jgi:hypothetical protein